MSNISIFQQQNSVATTREVSELSKALADSGGGSTSRRITMSKGVFRRIVNGKEAGKVKDGFLNVIIINALPKVSRQFYATAFDPDAAPTLPDCWSNLGDVPDPKAANAQSTSCATCPQNIDGSGINGKGRACRFNRRIAVLLENDMSGDIYQFNIPAKSLFGKGVGNTHPFESYIKFLPANGESIDRIITQIAFDENETADVLKFTPVRHLTDEEIDVVEAAQSTQESKRIIQLTVAQQDGVVKLPPAAAKPAFESEAEVVEEPVVKRTKKAEVPPAAPKAKLADVVNAWSDN
jgi:hypothetical protein|tara:strand:- start:1540 stop:2421 length:882 start_codon:yes stop_codon:yes gene_type:complete